MTGIFYENLDIDLADDIRNTKTKIDTHVDKVASSTELGHVKIDDSTIKINPSGQLYSTTSGDVTTLVEYYQYILPTTTVGQTSWEIPLATFEPTKDLIIVTHNTTILSNQLYNITSLGNVYSLNITEQIPTAIASNNVYIIILKGKSESPVVPTELAVDNTTIIKEDNTLKAVNIKGLTIPTANINEYLTGTTSNIQTQINDIQTNLTNALSGVKYLGRFETYSEINGLGVKTNGDMAVVLADETKDGARTLYIYNDSLSMWQFIGAFDIGAGSQFADNFLELLDTPSSYLNASGKNVTVNVAGTGLEFTDADYNKLINKPTSTTTAIDKAVTDSHTHDNKTELDRLGINLSNRLTIDGVDYVVEAIGSAVDSAKSYVDNQLASHDSKNATTTSKGHVQIGNGINVVDGVISVSPTVVPDATKTTKGQVQVGNGIEVSNGIISVNPTPDASTTTKGLMQVGSGLSVTNGVVSTNPISDATTTSKGIVQIGDGLAVADGVVSVISNYANTFDIDTLPSQFPLGTTISPISTNVTLENYRKMTALVNQLLGYTLDVNTSTTFRFTFKTVRVAGASYQQIDVFYNVSGNTNKAFEFYRLINSDGYDVWTVNVKEIYTNVVPSMLALKGTLVTNVNTGIKYVKSTGTTLPLSNTGWVAINAPKQFLAVGRANTDQNITAVNQKILFNSSSSGSISYAPATGLFNLESGRNYRITVTAGADIINDDGYMALGLFDSGTNIVHGSRAVWISTKTTFNQQQSSVLDFVFNPPTSGNYSIGVTALSGTATLKALFSRLIIQEI